MNFVSNPLEQFDVVSYIPLQILGLKDISFTNSSLYLVIASAIVFFIFSVTLKQIMFVPNRWQTMLEKLYEFVYDLISQNIGPEGDKYFPFLFFLFVFLLACNVLGMIPYSFTVTSHIILTFFLSLSIFLGVTFLGLSLHGFHFFSYFVPAGAPVALLPMLVVIEIISYIARAFSLGIRLFANMMSGHTLVKILAGFSFQMFNSGTALMTALAFIPLLVVVVVTGLEIVIAMLQAYVFTVLTCIYIHDAIHLH
jgi:ATP synthase subunit 6